MKHSELDPATRHGIGPFVNCSTRGSEEGQDDRSCGQIEQRSTAGWNVTCWFLDNQRKGSATLRERALRVRCFYSCLLYSCQASVLIHYQDSALHGGPLGGNPQSRRLTDARHMQ